MGTFGFDNDIGLVAPGTITVFCGIHPHSETDGTHADLLHQGEDVGLYAIGIVELLAVGFHFRTPADVGASGKRCILGLDYCQCRE